MADETNKENKTSSNKIIYEIISVLTMWFLWLASIVKLVMAIATLNFDSIIIFAACIVAFSLSLKDIIGESLGDETENTYG